MLREYRCYSTRALRFILTTECPPPCKQAKISRHSQPEFRRERTCNQPRHLDIARFHASDLESILGFYYSYGGPLHVHRERTGHRQTSFPNARTDDC